MGDVVRENVSVSILERLKELDNLPHFPGTLLKLDREIANNSDITMEEVVDMVAQDPRLVAGLIKLANCAKYRVGKPVTDLATAVTSIGFKQLGQLAYAIHFQEAFKRKTPFSDAHYLKHALASAFLAKELALSLGREPGMAFLAGLMRDIGIYLLAIDDREKYLEVIKLTKYDIKRLPAAENKLFGTYHALISARLLQDWKFPNAVIIGVAFHHAPEKANEPYRDYAFLTCLAEYGVFRLGYENGIADISDEDIQSPPKEVMAALQFFDLKIETFDELISKAEQDVLAMNMIG